MKPYLPLFQTKFEMAAAGAFLATVFLLNIFISYLDFREFKSYKWATIKGEVTSVTQLQAKNGREYKRLYIKSDDGLRLGVTYFAKDEFEPKMRVGFRVKSENVTFGSFLAKRFYAPSVLVWSEKIEDTSLKSKIYGFIAAQHESKEMQELYGALFLATPISKALRYDIQRYGSAHLVAISGFHLGVIFSFLYAFLYPIYRFFQNRFFPYRNSKWDISVAIFIFLFGYLWLIDLTPSFLRAYVMGVCGFLFLSRGINVLSYEMLSLTTALLAAFFPYLIFNVGFILSVAGVFFIFVFIENFGKILKVWQSAVLINVWLFFAMLPLVHFWFGMTSFQQLWSIILSMIFFIFYPLSAFLHLIGAGGLIDSALLFSLSIESKTAMINTPLWLLWLYIFAALGCAFRRIFMLPVALLGGGYLFFLKFAAV